MNNTNDVLLKLVNLQKHFPIKQQLVVKALDGVSIEIKKGQTYGLVGESGCGKSTTGRTLLRLLEPTSGEVFYKGENILNYTKKQMKTLRQDMQIIFQDPYSSLNPRINVTELVGESLIAQKHFPKRNDAWKEKVISICEKCGIPAYHLNRYPHQFSGGQRQRIGIARALALEPEFVVCDEPVSALDVSIQSSIINLLIEMQKNMGLSYLFISHDLSVVRYISDRIGVMYLGKLVEESDCEDLFANPRHPYTEALLSSIPNSNPKKRRELKVIEGDIPSNVFPPSGCAFRTRCPYVKDICSEETPELTKCSDGHLVACHFPLSKSVNLEKA